MDIDAHPEGPDSSIEGSELSGGTVQELRRRCGTLTGRSDVGRHGSPNSQIKQVKAPGPSQTLARSPRQNTPICLWSLRLQKNTTKERSCELLSIVLVKDVEPILVAEFLGSKEVTLSVLKKTYRYPKNLEDTHSAAKLLLLLDLLRN